MRHLNIKPTHKPILDYYKELSKLKDFNLDSEGIVSPAFANLLRHCAKQFNWTLAEKYPIKRSGRLIIPDGALLDEFQLIHGLWEAKDTKDNLEEEVKKKFADGYPRDNIIFQAPTHTIIWQNNIQVINEPITKPDYLIDALKTFFEYEPPEYEEWDQAVEEFKQKVPELGKALLELIEKEAQSNPRFIKSFEEFTSICRTAINPNLSPKAVEEMLIQHLLTERIFSKVFDNPDFAKHNIIAYEIEKVIDSLTSRSFSKADFLKKLNRFYGAIETTASTIDNYSEKQSFLNTVYEKFFQGFSVKVADTHGIVYTPQPVVNFMVNSVEEILQREFNRSLSDKNVHIIDPFVGTGNFIINIMRKMKRTALPYKYSNELHCNEVMLLPYYIASMNIEHEYYALTNEYKPFEGICLVDTFELAEEKVKALDLFISEENIKRVEKLKKTPLFVIISNPPYNSGQVNENDNNKNRRYKVVDDRVKDTYAKDSKATLKRRLNDPYVKAIRWASDRIKQNGEGIIAFITNNSFIDEMSFDGMRKHLSEDFNDIYILDLGGNVRENPKLSGTIHNVFGIQVGVSINVFIKNKNKQKSKIYYKRLDEYWRKEQKYNFLNSSRDKYSIKWKEIKPDKNFLWLVESLVDKYSNFIPIGTIQAKKTKTQDMKTIFKLFSVGTSTNKDAWAYNFRLNDLSENMKKIINVYNWEVVRWATRIDKEIKLDDFVLNDDKKIKWSSRLKECLLRSQQASFLKGKIRNSVYRPYSFQYLFFDNIMIDRRGQFPHIFPTPGTEKENKIIIVPSPGSKQIAFFISKLITDLNFFAGSTPVQCFPFYTYDEDGSNRKENITDWVLEEFRKEYKDKKIEKWDIFYYVYGLLHHPGYSKKYAANLRRELPRIPYATDFWAFSEAGKKLADLHLNYEGQEEYQLEFIENKDIPLDWRVEKMRLSKDKTQIIYNDFLTLAGIPKETFEYRLGNRSALDWIIDQYRIKTDKRSGIVNDPNSEDDPQYIVKLIGKIITVSLETVKIVKSLPIKFEL